MEELEGPLPLGLLVVFCFLLLLGEWVLLLVPALLPALRGLDSSNGRCFRDRSTNKHGIA